MKFIPGKFQLTIKIDFILDNEKGMEPRKQSNDSRPDSPQSDDSSSESDLSSPSFRDSDFEGRTRDIIEAESSRDSILAMAPIGGSFENESDSNSTVTAKTVLPLQLETDNNDKMNRVSQKQV